MHYIENYRPNNYKKNFTKSKYSNKTTKHLKARIVLLPLIVSALLGLGFSLYYNASYKSFTTPQVPKALDENQAQVLKALLDTRFPERNSIIKDLPYKTEKANFKINAGSAILIDTNTGDILFEKDADEEIPPASMTKLVEMYVVFDAVEKGEISLDDEVPLPPKSWAVNLPRDSSIMFLAQGHKVTLRELLLGLSVASGNDASIAIANYVSGNMKDFVERMNNCVKDMGLTRTHFVESSGYNKNNITTAREFATFCKMYVQKYPKALEEFHSQKILQYPQEKNLPEWQKASAEKQMVTQYNSNKLLGHLDGCDGLKTGFIYESGFNLALTAIRNGVRYLSVTMKGPGIGGREGNKYRTQDANNLMEYGFKKFTPYTGEHTYVVPVCGSKEKSIKLVPALEESFSIPIKEGLTPDKASEAITVTVEKPNALLGKIYQGEIYGSLTYKLDDTILRTVPLVADRDTTETKGLDMFVSKKIYKKITEEKEV